MPVSALSIYPRVLVLAKSRMGTLATQSAIVWSNDLDIFRCGMRDRTLVMDWVDFVHGWIGYLGDKRYFHERERALELKRLSVKYEYYIYKVTPILSSTRRMVSNSSVTLGSFTPSANCSAFTASRAFL